MGVSEFRTKSEKHPRSGLEILIVRCPGLGMVERITKTLALPISDSQSRYSTPFSIGVTINPWQVVGSLYAPLSTPAPDNFIGGLRSSISVEL